jgi:hypothetical protein
MRTSGIIGAILTVAVAHSSFADGNNPPDQPSSSPATAISNDLTNYQGDRVTFNTDLVVRVQKADGSAGDLYCLPAHVKLRGGVGYSASQDNKTETGTLFRLLKDPQVQGKIQDKDENKDQDKVRQKDTGQPSGVRQFLRVLSGAPNIDGCAPDALPSNVKPEWYKLTTGVDLRVPKEALQRSPPNRYGLTYGLLAVPFKYQLTGPKEFTGSATVGPYFGYRTMSSSRGYGISYIAFLGYSNISVTQVVNGESKSQNLASIGYGIGAVATVKGNFQLGAVLGFDHVSKDSDYKYNNKPWLAVEFGYSFLQ